ncbi:hypothetical protein BOTBODRAFT_37407 [Botryobasidium botryosum FD-172 SS1]|uniref:FAD/NAD(P)-binding domain-containing protein n=1 Tax=Botryobasidium botryosum (strain FD-172 SS1) TaxID=930990 RepID=A0A067MBQ6_BOTB1|nr:hypothetical protein BOTBODRAFT_37407 [Botryobasidium botryosum FD-172 SS1]
MATSELDPAAIAKNWLDQIGTAFQSGDVSTVSTLFFPNGYWRDLLSLSWDFRTLKGPDEIKKYLSQDVNIEGNLIKDLELEGQAALIQPSPEISWVQARFKFNTSIARGRGVVRLMQDNETGRWLGFTFYTGIEELHGYEERIGRNRPTYIQGDGPGHKTWKAQREQSIAYENRDPEVVVIGGGQAGLTVAARLSQLDVDTLIIEQNNRVGDNWRNRYDSLVLHDPVYYAQMPYLPFPDTWPMYIPKDQVGDWLESYAKVLDLNVWTSTTVLGEPKYDEVKKDWAVTVRRADGSVKTFHPKHLVIATSTVGEPYSPDFTGVENFKGQVVHSTQFKSGRDYAQKRVAVIGTGTSAIDIARDLYEQGAHTTIVQRSTAIVISAEAMLNVVMKGMWDGTGPPTDIADLLSTSFPIPVTLKLAAKAVPRTKQYDSAMLEGLEKAGFGLNYGPNDGGILARLYEKPSGYYIDVGGAQPIIDGKIKVKQGQEIDHFDEKGIVFSDGSKLDIDAAVLATGYTGTRDSIAKLLGDDIAERISPTWGLNSEGELYGLWRNAGHPQLWLHGGNLAMCRVYSKPLALQIKAQLVGLWKL